MRIGIVCPYTWDVPGGVQQHIRDLAEALIELGHEVSVISPADDDTPLPDYVVPAGRAVPVPYNGSVARLAFGFLSAARVRRWVKEGNFDVLHVHEPAAPSLSLLACWVADGPIVATAHTANPRSRVMHAAYLALQTALEKISGWIAVSEAARTTLVEHMGGDAVLIPNGVTVRRYEKASPLPGWLLIALQPRQRLRQAQSLQGPDHDVRPVDPQPVRDLLRAPRLPPATVLTTSVSAADEAHRRTGNLCPVRAGDQPGQAILHIASQGVIRRQLGHLGPSGSSIGMPLRGDGPISRRPRPGCRVASKLPADRRRAASHLAGDLPHATAFGLEDGDLLTLGKRQVAAGQRSEADGSHPASLTEPPTTNGGCHPDRA